MLITQTKNPVLYEQIKQATVKLLKSSTALYKATHVLLLELTEKINELNLEIRRLPQECPTSINLMQKEIDSLNGRIALITTEQEKLKNTILSLNKNVLFFTNSQFQKDNDAKFFKNKEYTHNNIYFLENTEARSKYDATTDAFSQYRNVIENRNNLFNNKLKIASFAIAISGIICFFTAIILLISLHALSFQLYMSLVGIGTALFGLGCLINPNSVIMKHNNTNYQDYIELAKNESFIPENEIEEALTLNYTAM